MLKVLLKKQLLEILKKDSASDGKKKTSPVVLALVYALVFSSLGFMFYQMADLLCAPLTAFGYAWLYFAIMGMVAIAIGVFGSVFSTYASMYLAKDNELLLSMPIKTRTIIASRLLGVFITGTVFQLVVMVPAVAVYFVTVKGLNFLGIALPILSVLALSVVILCLSCLLGWLVALISSKLKSKNFMVVILSLAFIVGYYTLYSKAYELLTSITVDPTAASEKVKLYLYPIYKMGQGAAGDTLAMALCLLVCALLFALVYFILCRNFVKIAIGTKVETASTKTVGYQSKTLSATLLKKELKRFTSSATYMLNCGIGTVMMPVLAVVVATKLSDLPGAASGTSAFIEGLLALITAAAVCAGAATNYTTAASVSLEGKELWIIQSLPVHPFPVLLAKLKLQLILTVPMALILMLTAIFTLGFSVGYALLIIFVGLSFCFLSAMCGLCLNLKMPKLDWTTEAVPAKRSAPVTLCLLGGWALIAGLGVLYYFILDCVSAALYLGLVGAIFTVGAAMLYLWLKLRGCKIFATL